MATSDTSVLTGPRGLSRVRSRLREARETTPSRSNSPIPGQAKTTSTTTEPLSSPAMIPVLTFGGITIAGLLNGSVVVEVVFAWPGIGLLLLEGVVSRDFPLTEGAILLSGAFYIMSAVIIDILYGYVDPRVRVS